VKPFLFCPSCGSRLEGDANSDHGSRCSACGRKWFRNSAPTAGAVILRGDRALITERGVEPRKGCYDIPGGFLMAGEDPLHGLRRELEEELGDIEVEVGPVMQMVPHPYGDEGDFVLAIGFIAELVGGEPEAADDVASVRWIGIDELDDVEFAWSHDRELVRKALGMVLEGGSDGG
jgi:ADP-ribose pyrophosphatase YjhB (NUDIX family)